MGMVFNFYLINSILFSETNCFTNINTNNEISHNSIKENQNEI
ncbi:MAG: hypothetical protein TRG1_490 [Flavobacteriaceae bacterium FS1-H7996/R]|nr:MAG: hypothetical protein TRG1_490 [Flavobacteriaceae bacterium FS1-H7996/R]